MGAPVYQILPTFDVEAAENVPLDFKNYPEIVAGQTIASATFTVTRADGGDNDLVTTPAPGGAMPVSGAVVQFALGIKDQPPSGTAGVEYLLKVLAVTDADKVLVGNFKLALVE